MVVKICGQPLLATPPCLIDGNGFSLRSKKAWRTINFFLCFRRKVVISLLLPYFLPKKVWLGSFDSWFPIFVWTLVLLKMRFPKHNCVIDLFVNLQTICGLPVFLDKSKRISFALKMCLSCSSVIADFYSF